MHEDCRKHPTPRTQVQARGSPRGLEASHNFIPLNTANRDALQIAHKRTTGDVR